MNGLGRREQPDVPAGIVYVANDPVDHEALIPDEVGRVVQWRELGVQIGGGCNDLAQGVGDHQAVADSVVDVLRQHVAVVAGWAAGVVFDDAGQATQPVVEIAGGHVFGVNNGRLPVPCQFGHCL